MPHAPRTSSSPPSPPPPGRAPRWLYAAFAYLCVALALIGVLLPGLPTVPFLLLAAWAAARGSSRLHAWLYRHPRFGAALIEWEEQRAVSRASKVGAIVLLVASWLFMLWRLRNPWVSAAMGLLFVGVSTFLLTRPEPVRPSPDERRVDGPPADASGAGRGADDGRRSRAPG